ncbi:hypothetical protein WJX73_000747 [Symbiochloris irregularis]|uniref:GRIP domain-containing protein n=1 Tax=Symbiochloris irregularis TaxID=706552 RepID=A0AAW1PDK3_9CHLO
MAPSQWPPALRGLVAEREAAASAAAAAGVRAEAEEVERGLESDLESARAQAAQAVAAKEQAVLAREEADARVMAVGEELREQERILRARFEEALAESQSATSAAREEARQAHQAASEAQESAASELKRWRSEAERLAKEARHVRIPSNSFTGAPTDPTSPLPPSRSAPRSTDSFKDSVDSPMAAAPQATAQLPPLLNHQMSVGRSGDLGPSRLGSFHRALSSEIEPADGAAGNKDQLVHALQARIGSLERELRDSDNTHRLRDRAQQVAKEEIAEMSRSVSRSEVNVDYLKAVLVDGFEAGALPSTSSLFPVLARLLSFSPEDLQRAKSTVSPGVKKGAATGGIKSGAGGLQRMGSTVRPAIGRPGSSGIVK